MKKKENAQEITQEEVKKKDPRKSGLMIAIGGSLLLIALGVLLLLRPDFGTATVASVLGWIMIAGGAICIAVSILNWELLGLKELLIGIAIAALGIFIVVKHELLASAFGIIIGIYVGYLAAVSILEGLKLKKAGYQFWPSVILGLVMLAQTVALVFLPMDSANIVVQVFVRIVGGFMIASGLTNMVFRSIAAKKLRTPKEEAVAEDDE